MTLAVIGLGSNLGDCVDVLRAARIALEAIANIVRYSALYETAPIGPPQPMFLNAAVMIEVSSMTTAPRLVQALLAIETKFGRVREIRFGPRIIDLDLLAWDAADSEDTDAQVPHPRLLERSFALVPLLEVWPDGPDNLTWRRAQAGLTEQGVTRVETDW